MTKLKTTLLFITILIVWIFSLSTKVLADWADTAPNYTANNYSDGDFTFGTRRILFVMDRWA